MQCTGQPSGAFSAGRQDYLVILVTAGRGVRRLHQVRITDEAGGPAADCLQVLHGQVHAMLGGGTDVVIRAGATGEDSTSSAEKKLYGWHPRLARTDQRQHHDVARLLLLLRDEIV